ncbi:STAS-like domain-containing protein [Deinococcus radiomollis]|uniref:STAS-like domain-containing protein n=1 Tax=Deinococcus radiomollis TaxID=468916 RepID=UPI00389147F3
MEITKVSLVNIAKTSVCTSSEDGIRVYDTIITEFTKNHIVDLSFKDVKYVISAFLNAAIGQLYKDYSDTYLRERLALSHVNNEQLEILREVIANAKKYYTNMALYEEHRREILGDDDGED